MGFEIRAKSDSTEPDADTACITANTKHPKLIWLAILVGTALCAAPGIVVAGLYGYEVAAHFAMRGWQETPATILRTDLVVRHGRRGGATYTATAKYAYTFAGVDYTSTRVSILPGSDDLGTFQQDAYRELERHRTADHPFRCFVNPANPAQAILYRDPRPEVLVAFAVATLSLGLVFSVLIPLAVVRRFLGERGAWRYRRLHSLAHPSEPWLWRGDWTKGELVASNRFELIRIGLLAAIWNIVTIPLWPLVPAVATGRLSALLAVGLIGAGWVAAALAVKAWRRPRRSVFRITRIPATVERGLVGQIETTARPNAAGRIRLALRCVWIAQNKTARRERVLWEATQAVVGTSQAGDSGTVHAAVQFSIPAGAPGTNRSGDKEETQNRIVWRLIIVADPPAHQPVAVFEVPVFRQPGDSMVPAPYAAKIAATVG